MNGAAYYNLIIPSGNVSIQARFKSSSTVPDSTYGGAGLMICNPNGYSGGTENGGYAFSAQQYNYAIYTMPGYGAINQCGPSNVLFSYPANITPWAGPKSWNDYTLRLDRSGEFLTGFIDGIPVMFAHDGTRTSGVAGLAVVYNSTFYCSELRISTNSVNQKWFATYGHSYVQGLLNEQYGVGNNGYRYSAFNYWNKNNDYRWYFIGSLAQGDIPTPVTDGQSGAFSSNMLTTINSTIATNFPTPSEQSNAIVGPIEYNDANAAVNLTTFYDNVLASISGISTYSPLIKIFVVTAGNPAGTVVDVLPYTQKVREAYVTASGAGMNVYLIDWATQASGTDWSTDHIHPSAIGFMQMGNYIATRIESILNPKQNTATLI